MKRKSHGIGVHALACHWNKLKLGLQRGARAGAFVSIISLFCGLVAQAQTSAISRSGQFIITGVESGTLRPYTPELSSNTNLVKLEPALLTVSCERIKLALLGALNVPDQWREIHVQLHPARQPNEEIVITASRFNDAWNYEVALPDAIAPIRLIRAITQVLLVEMANRPLPPQSAGLPDWLAEGMPQYLIASSDIDFVLQSAPANIGNRLMSRADMHEGRRTNPFSQARERLRQREPLTIEQLSHPAAGQLAGAAGEIYQDNALLFINELLQLKNGGACLAAMLPELPWDPDWRVAFLKAFRSQFKREIDFERWWALQSAYFASRDPNQSWPRAESLAKLGEILRTPFEVRLKPNEPALYTDVSLQAIIKGWKLERQSPVLREKISLLQSLQLRVAPELKPLVQQYRDVLAAYLDKMDGSAAPKPAVTGRNSIANARMKETGAPSENDSVVKSTLAQLDVLDERCAAWKVTHDKLPAPAR